MNEITSKLRHDIVFGVWEAGSPLKMEKLSERYKTSHMPIREALRDLHFEGLVVLEQRKSARVRPLDANFVSSIMDMRASLEAQLSRQAALKMDEPTLSKLSRTQDALEEALDKSHIEDALRLNGEFHNTIYLASGNLEAKGIIDRHWTLVSELLERFGYGSDRFSSVASDHRSIIDCFMTGSAHDAGVIMEAHVIKSKQMLLGQLARFDGGATSN